MATQEFCLGYSMRKPTTYTTPQHVGVEFVWLLKHWALINSFTNFNYMELLHIIIREKLLHPFQWCAQIFSNLDSSLSDMCCDIHICNPSLSS